METHEQAEVVAARPERHVKVTVRVLETEGGVFDLSIEREAPLREILDRGLALSGNALVPSPIPPVDTLHNLHHHEVGPAITDLEQPIWRYLREPHTSHDFGIKLALAFRVNARWAVAPTSALTPREILELVGLDHTQYTLYLPHSADPLPLDQTVTIVRGKIFEAQRDGKYGSA